mmetsp:Transcript_53268/g.53698  ORF Transcript_53268/g.53698 Transcript_53268/m.53698 type:complete len:203 (-) Transcript_53268:75-683(-)
MSTLKKRSVAQLLKAMGPRNSFFFLCSLIKHERWARLDQFLSDCRSREEARIIAEATGPIKMEKNQNLLHFACRFRPPLSIVMQIGNIDGRYFLQPDYNGQTPLHICTECGASRSVIKYVLNQYVKATEMRDIYGKTPLILGCMQLMNCNRNSLLEQVILDLSISRKVVLLEDNNGMDALDFLARKSIPNRALTILHNIAYC